MAEHLRTGLTPLSDLDDYEIAEGYPDIRGWTVYDETGREIGEVKELLVDTDRDEAVYATVDLDDTSRFPWLTAGEPDVRIPLDAVTMDDANTAVRLTRPLGMLTGPSAATAGTAEMAPERAGAPRRGEADTIDVVEERLEVEKQREKAGEVRIGKEVETETVHRQVPVEHEEVIVEREAGDRPISTAEARSHLEGREGEITVPVYGEEVEVTKRPVVAERLRIRKRVVQGTRDVSADVRRERATVEGEGAIRETRGPEGAAGRTIPEAERAGTLPEPETGKKPPRRP